jgi:hypothetical protein
MTFRILPGDFENCVPKTHLINTQLPIVLSGKTLTRLLANPAPSGTIRAAELGWER